MSDFLMLKSTEEQKEEGVDNPVDTAFIADREGGFKINDTIALSKTSSE